MPNNTESQITDLHHRIKREVVELYISSAIRSLGVSMIALYEPIYFYTLGLTVKNIVLYYICAYLLYILLLPLGGKIAVKYGFEHSMLFSVPFRIIYYIALYLISVYPIFIIFGPILFAIERSLYWSAYHCNLAYYGSIRNRGREVSGFRIMSFIVTVAGPFLGGLILMESNFVVLFTIVSILFFISIIPLFTTGEKFKPGKFSYKSAMGRLFKKQNRRKLIGLFGFGEDAVVTVIWPIFIYLLIDKYFSIGIVISLSTLFTIIVTYIIGRYTDTKHRNKIIKGGAITNFIIWLVRIFIKGPISIFAVDSASRVTRSGLIIPILTKTYELANKTGKYMKTIIFFEQSINIGRVLTLVAVLIVLTYTARIEFTFIPAGIMSFLYTLL